ncbi:MAG: winged helix-turn-helix transcriptional regulator [Candidatus Natronoplasma sp.]
MKNIDERNRKILGILQKDSRTPYTDIADELDVSEATVRKRVEKMKEEGIIERFTIDLDPSNLGYDMVTFLGLDVEPEFFMSALEELRAIEEVRWVAKSTGDHMIMSEIWAKDNDHLSKIMTEKVAKIKGVRDLCPAIILEKIR